MKITKTSILSGITRTVDLPVTEDQMNDWLLGGALIQNAMPHLSDDQREFLMTGITAEEWDETLSDFDPDDDPDFDDAGAFASAGYGTDEDYGSFGGDPET